MTNPRQPLSFRLRPRSWVSVSISPRRTWPGSIKGVGAIRAAVRSPPPLDVRPQLRSDPSLNLALLYHGPRDPQQPVRHDFRRDSIKFMSRPFRSDFFSIIVIVHSSTDRHTRISTHPSTKVAPSLDLIATDPPFTTHHIPRRDNPRRQPPP